MTLFGAQQLAVALWLSTPDVVISIPVVLPISDQGMEIACCQQSTSTTLDIWCEGKQTMVKMVSKYSQRLENGSKQLTQNLLGDQLW